ncbi:MAG: MIP/aquaporin family protein [Chloroflexota bacterium]
MEHGELIEAEEDAATRISFRGARRLLAELLGTFALTLVAAGGGVIAAVSHGGLGGAAQNFAPALVVMAMIYSVGPVSGAHFNPAVSLAFALRGDFPWRRVPFYWLAQFVGAVVAALVLRALFGTAGHLGASLPHHGALTSLVMEIILTFFLVTVILGTAANFRIVGHNAAIAVSATIALDGLFAAPISGASMNSARSFGPAVVGQQLGDLWIYFVGPTVGAVIAVAVGWLLRGPGNQSARKTASGNG